MLNYIELQLRLANIAESTKAEILYDMQFKVDVSDFFYLRFQKEIQFNQFLNHYAQ